MRKEGRKQASKQAMGIIMGEEDFVVKP